MSQALALPTRRGFIHLASGSLADLAAGVSAAPAAAQAAAQAVPEPGAIHFPPISAGTEAPEKPKPLPLPDSQRLGVAIVGLGRLSLNQILPAFAASRFVKPVALVSGDRAKAARVAAQYGVSPKSIYDYGNFDRIADDPAVKIVYIVLPNAMHAEYTVRAAKAGKHVLCEKPMAVSVAECRQMIDACAKADVRLMVAYRSQYESLNREIVRRIAAGELGRLKAFTAFNGQAQGDSTQWRLKKALAGGGALPDIGLYCLNAARFLSGEEPSQVLASTFATPGDPRFAEVEESVQFLLQFPSGFQAHCGASYSTHKSQFMRLQGELAWAELDPGFAYTGNRLRIGSVNREQAIVTEPQVEIVDQFAAEMDHMARCVMDGHVPHTPGEEGLQDQRVMDAIYESARTGRRVELSPPPRPTRGSALPPGENA